MVQFNNELDEYDYYYHREVITSVNPLTPDHKDPLPHPPHLPTPVHAFSGAGGAALANFITYPLDLIQTRLQVQKQVQSHRRKMKRDRHRLQKGKQRDLSHSRSSTSSTSSVDSDSDDGVKVRRRGRRRTRASTATEKHDSSDTGYMSAWELEYEQDETYDGVLDAAGKIFDKEGLGGLYRGVGWDTLGTVSGNLWYFLVYHLLRRQRMNILGPQHKHKPLPIAEELTIGIMSAALSRFVSSPLSNIVARKQTSAMLYPHTRPPSIFDIYHDIMRENGVTGFWAGYTASFWLTLNPSLTFLLYETAKPHVREKNHGKLDGVESFFLAALCKAVATTVTYPLNVARARLQLEGTGKELDMEEMFHEPNKIVKAKGLVDMLLYIVKKEGLSALYVGLGAELVKGFFTHGITMLAKEAVHKSILRLYYYILDL
ncbi:mitochondrial carrier, partial [Ascodesmis nigricans]